jgi:hypothetical protein
MTDRWERGSRDVSTEQEVIIPLEQSSVLFFGQPVIVVRLPDGRIGAVVSNMCGVLHLDVASQVRRIREDDTIAESLVSVRIQTETRGPVTMGVLIAWAIPFWLSHIQLTRVKDTEKREAIAYFKKEAANVLYAHFSHAPETLPAPSAVVPAEIREPATDAPALEWAEYHRQMATMYEWKASMDGRVLRLEDWQGDVEEQLYSHKQVLSLVPEILERLGEEKLSSEHQAKVKAKAKTLHELTEAAYPTIYYYLGQAFSVTKMEDIPELYWPEVEQWFNKRIDHARKRRGRK